MLWMKIVLHTLLYPDFTRNSQKLVWNILKPTTHCVSHQRICLRTLRVRTGWVDACVALLPLWPTSSLSISKHIWTCWKARHCCVCKLVRNPLETGQWKFGGLPFPLCWVTHNKTNYGVGKLKSLWGRHGKNGNIFSTPKEIPINIPSHIIPRSSAPGRHHIILAANHRPATLFLES